MGIEYLWNDTDSKIEVLGEKPVPAPLVYYTSHTDWPVIIRGASVVSDQ